MNELDDVERPLAYKCCDEHDAIEPAKLCATGPSLSHDLHGNGVVGKAVGRDTHTDE